MWKCVFDEHRNFENSGDLSGKRVVCSVLRTVECIDGLFATFFIFIFFFAPVLFENEARGTKGAFLSSFYVGVCL